MTTGRTVAKYCKFQIGDTGNVLRDIPVETFGEIGLTYEEVDVTALQDAIKKMLAGQATFSVTISGPFSNLAAGAASTTGQRPALSGSHTVLQPLNGGQTARSFGVYFGIQGDWAAGDPVFGAAASVIVTDYKADGTKYTAKISAAGSATNDVAWGTSQIS
jgi:hypothetical protein